VLARWPDAKPFPIEAMRSELEKGDLETKHQFRRRLALEIKAQKTSLVAQPVRKLKRKFFEGANLHGSSPNINRLVLPHFKSSIFVYAVNARH
jgi:hypothetical protein